MNFTTQSLTNALDLIDKESLLNSVWIKNTTGSPSNKVQVPVGTLEYNKKYILKIKTNLDSNNFARIMFMTAPKPLTLEELQVMLATSLKNLQEFHTANAPKALLEGLLTSIQEYESHESYQLSACYTEDDYLITFESNRDIYTNYIKMYLIPTVAAKVSELATSHSVPDFTLSVGREDTVEEEKINIPNIYAKYIGGYLKWKSLVQQTIEIYTKIEKLEATS